MTSSYLESVRKTLRHWSRHHIFNEEMKVESGIGKCTVVNIIKGKILNLNENQLPDEIIVNDIEEGEDKFFEFPDGDTIEKTKKDCFSIEAVLKFKLNTGKTICAK